MRRLLALFVLLTSPVVVTPAWAAEPVTCPLSIEVTPQVAVKPIAGFKPLPMAERHVLAGARLFDGDPADMADLIPDQNTTKGATIGMVWELRPGMTYTFVCTYAGTEMTMAATVPAGMKQCRATTKPIANMRPPGNTYLDASCR